MAHRRIESDGTKRDFLNKMFSYISEEIHKDPDSQRRILNRLGLDDFEDLKEMLRGEGEMCLLDAFMLSGYFNFKIIIVREVE